MGLKSSLDPRLLRRWSNELVRERLAFMNIVLPPKYWFKNSLLQIRKIWAIMETKTVSETVQNHEKCKLLHLFSAVSWTCLACLLSQWARISIIRNSFCSRRPLVWLELSEPWNLVRRMPCSSSGRSSNLRNIICCALLSLRPAAKQIQTDLHY